MREIIPALKRWQAAGQTGIVLATIVETRGSSLRTPGTRMALNARGDVAGSVSSGCVDGDTIAEMEAVLHGQFTMRRPFFGVSDTEAWSAGLACGGSVDILIERWSLLYAQLLIELDAGRAVGFASRTDEPVHLLRTATGDIRGTLGDPELDAAVLADLEQLWPGPHAHKHSYPQGEVFLEVIPPPPTMLIFGATDIAQPLARMAQIVGYRVIVSDARRTFLNAERFPHAEQRFGWPQKAFTSADLNLGWAVVVLFHDAKFDIPALTLALESDAYYIGFLGSRVTQADRHATLLAAGFTEAELSRIHGPVGLNIGGKEPQFIALSILAETVAVRHGRESSSLVVW
ncbi:MAG: XdhC/CoxI family protein [Chloroflexota bacterium]|nr:XdhC/CoxI family protein [Chloroflexota bacterium]